MFEMPDVGACTLEENEFSLEGAEEVSPFVAVEHTLALAILAAMEQARCRLPNDSFARRDAEDLELLIQSFEVDEDNLPFTIIDRALALAILAAMEQARCRLPNDSFARRDAEDLDGVICSLAVLIHGEQSTQKI